MRRWIGTGLVLVVVASCSSGGNKVVTATSSSSSSATTTTTSTPTTTSTTIATSTTLGAAVETAPSMTTATIDVCRNSTDPACGELVWDPPLVNRPLVVTLTADRTEVAPGDSVTITATLSDPDSAPHGECVEWSYYEYGAGPYIIGAESGDHCYSGAWTPCTDPPPRYGRWEPLGSEGGTATATFPAKAGTRTLTFRAHAYSGTPMCGTERNYQPNLADDGLYADFADGYLTITFA